jgi:hypothetical protein
LKTVKSRFSAAISQTNNVIFDTTPAAAARLAFGMTVSGPMVAKTFNTVPAAQGALAVLFRPPPWTTGYAVRVVAPYVARHLLTNFLVVAGSLEAGIVAGAVANGFVTAAMEAGEQGQCRW